MTSTLEDEPKEPQKEQLLNTVTLKNEAEIEKKYYAPLEEMRLRRLSRHNRQIIEKVPQKPSEVVVKPIGQVSH